MATMAYDFKPWSRSSYFGSGEDIMAYMKETVAEHGLEDRIKYSHKVTSSSFDSKKNEWTLEINGDEAVKGDELKTPEVPPSHRGESSSRRRDGHRMMTTKFLIFAQGYYSYDRPHRPPFKNEEAFEGDIVHAQFWPADLDLKGKKVAMIGSGATAVTLLPELAKVADKVTMVQRSPGYVFAAPSQRPLKWLQPYVYGWVYDWASRYHDVYDKLKKMAIVTAMPVKGKTAHRKHVREQLGSAYDRFDPTDFRPKYDLWDQRVCVAPDGDFYEALKSGKADIVTGQVKAFAANGVRMQTDRKLVEADVVVLATGLTMEVRLNLKIDGEDVDEKDLMLYRQAFLSDVPNCAILFGSTIASWTLSLGPACRFVCSHLNYMKRHGYAKVVVPKDPHVVPRPANNLQANYVKRASRFPTAGDRPPWCYYHGFLNILSTFLAAKFDTNPKYSK
mmetsp:Transcript_32983/g.105257  ORF Transcript_32983/g.105257 Transcript_32983/m.105257 type:complete len:447 (-) Transcript_32983:114-1454(-)